MENTSQSQRSGIDDFLGPDHLVSAEINTAGPTWVRLTG
jgi:hypothetical protein